MNSLPGLLANKEVLESLDWSELSLYWTTTDNRSDDDDDDDDAFRANTASDQFCNFVVTVGRSRRTRQTFRQERMRRDEMAAVLEPLLERISGINNNCSNNSNEKLFVVQQLHASTDGTIMLPVDCATKMIQRTKQLQGLHVGRGVTLTTPTCCTKDKVSSSSTDLMLLVQALSHHPTLRTVSLHNMKVNQESDSSNREQDSSSLSLSQQSDPSVGLLDPLVEAIASIPNLECVDLSLDDDDDVDGDGDEEQRQPDNELDHLDDFAFAAFTGRRRRRRSIHKWTAMRSIHKQHQGLVSPRALRSLFQTPSRLEQVSLWNWGLTDQHVLQGLVPALLLIEPDNSTAAKSGIHFLSLRQNPAITTTGWKALYQVVEDGHNYTLQYVMSDDLDENNDIDDDNNSSSSQSTLSCHARGKFFLQLNQQDRGELLSQTSGCFSKTKWCQVLEQFSNDPTALYYWVQQASPAVF